MRNAASIAEVQSAGVTIEAEEAVAIAQQLILALRASDSRQSGEPPYGPPTVRTVYLVEDGSVVCRTCQTTPAVSEIAILLQAMLPPELRVPGGLRYAIARALLDVDVPPFDSLDDLGETLQRYERGPRDLIVRRVMQRLAMRRALARIGEVDRRRQPQTTELRRALREADARLYLQQVATETVAMTVAAGPKRPTHSRAAVMCVAAGLGLIAAGEFIDRSEHSPSPAPMVVAPASGFPSYDATEMAPPAPPSTAEPPRATNVSRAVLQPPDRRPRVAKRSTRAQAPREETRKPPASRGVLEKLRLNWLKNVLTSL